MSPAPLTGRVDQLANAIASRVVAVVVDAIDFDDVLAKVDVNALVRRVDVEAVVDRVDIGAIVDRVDIDALLDRIDVEAIVRRVDVNAIVEEIDIDALMRQTELGSVIARSTSGLFTEVLDIVRSQAVGLDDFIARWTYRLLRRRIEDLPAGPPLLVARDAPHLERGA